MIQNGNFPLMSSSEWDEALVNKEDNAPIDCNITVSVSMSKDASIKLSDYSIDDSGEISFAETNWEEAANAEIYTPAELLDVLKEKLETEIANCEEEERITGDPRYLEIIKHNRMLIEQCNNWTVDEHEVLYY